MIQLKRCYIESHMINTLTNWRRKKNYQRRNTRLGTRIKTKYFTLEEPNHVLCSQVACQRMFYLSTWHSRPGRLWSNKSTIINNLLKIKWLTYHYYRKKNPRNNISNKVKVRSTWKLSTEKRFGLKHWKLKGILFHYLVNKKFMI